MGSLSVQYILFNSIHFKYTFLGFVLTLLICFMEIKVTFDQITAIWYVKNLFFLIAFLRTMYRDVDLYRETETYS